MSIVVPVALSAPLQGLRLIEASAGTGKTWTLSALYLRLVVERGLDSEAILTVTFTKAATAELRDRIRSRLQQMLDLLEGREAGDDFCRALQATLADAALARRSLIAALRSVDEAAIYTIHGFCQRVLSDRAFSSGVGFDSEIVPDTSALRREIVLDFWRRRIVPADAERERGQRLFLAWLDAQNVSIDSLSRWAGGLASKPRLRILPIDAVVDLQTAALDFDAARQVAASVFASDREVVADVLVKLKSKSYQKAHVAGRMTELERYFADEYLIALPEKAEYFLPSVLAERCGAAAPTHAFFDAIDMLRIAAETLLDIFARSWRGLRLELLAQLRSELPLRLQARGEQSYDDLLQRLQQALAGSGGEQLAAELRRRYPAAMIDEFQDTDPLQWDIVRRIWAEGIAAGEPLCAFLVGDPKQAIYSFRGADIHAYLAAQSACEHRHELLENQRSVPAYVEALNTLYERASDPFRHAEIRYRHVLASPRAKPALIEDGVEEAAPLRLFALASETGTPISKTRGDSWATETTAAEIARLLQAAGEGRLSYGGRPLRAGDIAVLVRSHYQARGLRRELARLGVGSAEQASDNVFASAEAEALERLLQAIATPHRGGTLKAALLGPLLGWNLPQVLELEQREDAWEPLLNEFEHYRLLWRDRGFMRMLRELLRRREVLTRLAAHSDGERRLTNLFHLAELLQNEQHRLHGLEAQLRWLDQHRREAAESKAEDAQLRLESDAALVQLLTVHASKGLEYPVVFLPFLWSGKDRYAGQDLIPHHAGEAQELCVAGDPADPAAVMQAALEESLAEDLRLAYVALTRAKNRCYLFTGDFKDRALSAVGQLLHGAGDDSLAALESLQAASKGSIRLQTAPLAMRVSLNADASSPLLVRQLRGALPPGQTLTSYSALSKQVEELALETLPDHDQHVDSALPLPIAPGGGRFAFPRGAAPGTCLHAVLEHIDASALPPSWMPAIEAQLRNNGQPAEWAPQLAAWLAEVVSTPLYCPATAERLSLAAINSRRCLIELAFHLPLRDVDPARISLLAAGQGIVLTPLATQRLNGYLKGFVDLVFEHQGRWYVADYKSNWLGDRIEDYDAAALNEAMAEHDYHLQYMLYVVALHRWLKWRVNHYDYEQHFGGVLYLFLRGMDARGLGVYASRPPRVLIEQLDQLLAGEALSA